MERKPRRVERDKEFEERVVVINRVTKVVKGGRRFRFAALVVIGDKKGRVGYGTGKANEVPDAIKKASENAKKNLFRVPLVNLSLIHISSETTRRWARRRMADPRTCGISVLWQRPDGTTAGSKRERLALARKVDIPQRHRIWKSSRLMLKTTIC